MKKMERLGKKIIVRSTIRKDFYNKTDTYFLYLFLHIFVQDFLKAGKNLPDVGWVRAGGCTAGTCAANCLGP